MLKFPITHVLTNDDEMEGIGYFHIPRREVSHFIDNIFEFKRVNKEKINKLEIILNSNIKIRHFVNIQRIS
ncbi:MAG: hypothetical protein HeimC3_43680 [Candidatus Heimdallarchaeota archaeon LC_3]|nr:MAG: hypothetical protein HeimC3_43680 [Candidatus Heimdallarchaeota archaeon LC_3]